MKKIPGYFFFLLISYFSPTALAGNCADLNGSWHGQLGGLNVILNINLMGASSTEFTSADGTKSMIGGMGSACDLKGELAHLWIWHQIDNDKGTDWYTRMIISGYLNEENQLIINTYKYSNRTGKTESGSGILYQ